MVVLEMCFLLPLGATEFGIPVENTCQWMSAVGYDELHQTYELQVRCGGHLHVFRDNMHGVLPLAAVVG